MDLTFFNYHTAVALQKSEPYRVSSWATNAMDNFIIKRSIGVFI